MIVSAGGPTVALRCPKHTVFQALLYDVGVPLAAPSANRSGETSPTTAQHVIESLGQRIHLIVDAGPCAEGIESTVVDLTCEPPRLLRPGPIAPDDLRAFLPDLVLGPERDEQHAPLRSPGLLTKHYAPRTPLRLISSPTQIIETPEPIGLVTFGTDVPVQQNMLHHDLTRDPTVAARQLYTVLHELDARGLSEILVVEPPPTEAWLGVRDRLMRAAASA
jgi:L-threonylcarbamoyladenylate synthase